MAPVLERSTLRVEVGDLDAVEPLERQHAAARVAPEDPRDAHVRMAGEVAVERVGVARLEPVVELLADRPGELVDELARVDEVECANALLRDARGLVEQRDVRFDLARRARTLHLHGDALAVRKVARCTWPIEAAAIGLLLELGEELVDREAEVLLDHLLDVCRAGTRARRPGARAARR